MFFGFQRFHPVSWWDIALSIFLLLGSALYVVLMVTRPRRKRPAWSVFLVFGWSTQHKMHVIIGELVVVVGGLAMLGSWELLFYIII